MKSILSLVVFVSLCLNYSYGLSDDLIRHIWDNFKKSHGKIYINSEHENQRLDIFKQNLKIIETHNNEYSMGLHTYTLGVNVFADWTIAEFKEKMFGTRYNRTYNKGGSSGTFLRLPKSVKVPGSMDWRQDGAVTPVKNQGQCGSCWAFSTTGSLEGAHFRASGKLVSLSEQQLVDCSGKFNNEGCNGGLMDNAFEYIKSNGGLDTEESYPYHARDEKCHFKAQNVGATLTGYVDVASGDEEALKEAVATVGPVSIAIDVTEDKFMLYKSGVLVDDSCSNGEEDLNHGVLVVGYGNSTSESGKSVDFWIVKNSWGESWGEHGYVRMARNLNNMCGVATKASYPLVKKE